jgi:hypothetical protein
LPLEANEKIEALKQYYGITHEEHLVVRGVEIRRHDTLRFTVLDNNNRDYFLLM